MIFPKFFNKIKNFKEKINEFENAVNSECMSFSQIMEKNAALELEIAQRMEELQQANNSILTLQNIWSTMNSSDPLNEVLKTIAQGMTHNLGYLNAVIFQLYGDDPNGYLKIREQSFADNYKNLKNILDNVISDFSIPQKLEDNTLIKSITEQEIKIIRNYDEIFAGTNFKINNEEKEGLNKLFKNNSIVVIPIIFQKKIFGTLLVVSPRNDLKDTELNFLNLFAKQIELAVTIADLFQTIKQQAITDGLTTKQNVLYV